MVEIGPVGIAELDLVVDLDQRTNGSSRRDFFTKRFDAQGRTPEAFVSLGASEFGSLVGFVCCHMLQGEFGSDELAAVLDSIAVEPKCQGRGVGHELMSAMKEEIRGRGGRAIHTQVGWNQPRVLEFFSGQGFAMAPRLILQRGSRDADF
jgi:ribosomal protein S18 acetylase RimI-like enzyme